MEDNPLLRTPGRVLRRWRAPLLGAVSALACLGAAGAVAVGALVSPVADLGTQDVPAADTVPSQVAADSPDPSPSPSPTPERRELERACEASCTIVFEASAAGGLELQVTADGELADYRAVEATSTHAVITVTGTGTFQAVATGTGPLTLDAHD